MSGYHGHGGPGLVGPPRDAQEDERQKRAPSLPTGPIQPRLSASSARPVEGSGPDGTDTPTFRGVGVNSESEDGVARVCPIRAKVPDGGWDGGPLGVDQGTGSGRAPQDPGPAPGAAHVPLPRSPLKE